jgi:hypothetical protein
MVWLRLAAPDAVQLRASRNAEQEKGIQPHDLRAVWTVREAGGKKKKVDILYLGFYMTYIV